MMQARLAEEVGVSDVGGGGVYISRMESGTGKPGLALRENADLRRMP